MNELEKQLNEYSDEHGNIFVNFMNQINNIILELDALHTIVIDVAIKLESIRREIKGDDHYA